MIPAETADKSTKLVRRSVAFAIRATAAVVDFGGGVGRKSLIFHENFP
jgi:hypothetical protein